MIRLMKTIASMFFFLLALLSYSCSVEMPLPNLSDLESEFTLLALNHVPSSDKYSEGGILQNQHNNPKYTIREWQGTPSIGVDRYNTLYSAWITGGLTEGTENYITVATSKDNGVTWTQNKLIVYVNTVDSTRLMDVGFHNDRYGNLYMTWAKHVKKKNVKEWAVVWYSKIGLVGDTVRYSLPRRIAEGSMLNKPYYSSHSKKVYFPIAHWYEGDTIRHNAFIYEARYDSIQSTSNLVDFKKIGYIPMKQSIRTIYEHMLVELDDKSFLGMVRTLDGIYFSRSKDAKVWDYAQKFTLIGNNTAARFCLRKLKSGRLLLIINNSLSRSNMKVFLSDNGGKSWPYSLTLDGGNYVSYPDMIESLDGRLNIVYDYARKPHGTIYFVNLSESDILTGNVGNIRKVIISTLK